MQNQPMMRMQAVWRRDVRFQPALHLQRRLAGSQPSAVGDAKDMGIHGDGRLAEGDVAHHIGAFASDPGERRQGLGVSRNLPAVLLRQNAGKGDDVRRLGFVEADGFDMVAQFLLPQREHFPRRVGEREQRFGGAIDPLVRRLRRQDHGDQQGIGVGVMQLAAGMRGLLGEAAEQSMDGLRFHGGKSIMGCRGTAGFACLRPALLDCFPPALSVNDFLPFRPPSESEPPPALPDAAAPAPPIGDAPPPDAAPKSDKRKPARRRTRDATTPMMEQYLRIKRQHPAALLFYRMGDFYELFFDDAVAAAAALDIALTHRGKHLGRDIPMCGVPVHSAETYLSRLIRKGFRVVVCEQTGEVAAVPGGKKGGKSVMNREVARIITPGTLTEDALLDARANNYLVSLAYDGGAKCGLAWADVSDGSFAVRIVPTDALGMELARLAPGELLLPDTALSLPAVIALKAERDGILTPLAEGDFDPRLGEQRLLRLLSIVSLEAVGDYAALELSACGALIGYVETTQVGRLPTLEAPRRHARRTHMEIDAATRRNLELVSATSGERKHSLLGVIDKTATGPGARMLREWLAAPLLDVAAIERRLDAVACLNERDALREELRVCLRRLPDMARALGRLSFDRGGPRDLAVLRDGLRAAHEIRERICAADRPDAGEGFGESALPAEVLGIADDIGSQAAEMEARLRDALVATPPLLLRDGGMVAPGYDDTLDEIRSARDDSRKIIAALQTRYARKTGIGSLKIRHNGILGYHIEVSPTHADRLMSGEFRNLFFHRQTLASAARFSSRELAEVAERILHAGERALEKEKRIFEELRVEALRLSETLFRIVNACARLDVFAALGEVARVREYVRPRLDASRALDIRGGRHPVVELFLDEGKSFVPNDCALCLEDAAAENGDAEGENVRGKRIWLLTGPNMAGKSTFLRQNALIVILAQMGGFVPATSARIGVVDRIFSRIGAADDLAGGRSTFMVEMIETAAILNQASSQSLVILDEIGRGTATFDGLAIAWAVVEHLHDALAARAIFATHYHELTELRERLDGLEAVTLRTREWRGDIVFLHEIIRGVADGSYGVQVARLAGLPAAVIARAREKLAALEAQGYGSRPLFAGKEAAAGKGAPPPKKLPPVHPALAALGEIAPDEMSPKEALETLYHLHSLLRRTDGEAE